MHPVLLELGPFSLRSFGLMLALGFALGLALSRWLARREGVKDEVILDLSVWIMLGTVVGARAFYVLVQPGEFAGRWWAVFAVWEGGIVYYGGLIGAGLTTYFWLKRQAQPVWRVADALAPGLALGQVFGRFGCFLNGCCYGRVDHAHGLVFPGIGDGLPHLPVMLYEAAFCAALAGFLIWFRGRRAYAGQVFWLYVALYAVGRFLLEYLRGDAERGTLFSGLLSPGQWVSLLALPLALIFHLRHRPKSA